MIAANNQPPDYLGVILAVLLMSFAANFLLLAIVKLQRKFLKQSHEREVSLARELALAKECYQALFNEQVSEAVSKVEIDSAAAVDKKMGELAKSIEQWQPPKQLEGT